MATTKEVARRAGVSSGTVSNVLTGNAAVSHQLRERVLKAIKELGYEPNAIARSLKLNRTKMLGMVVTDITNPFFSQMVRGAQEASLKHHYLLVAFNTDDRVEREKEALLVLRARRVDGILLVVAPAHESPSHILDTLKSKTPVVCLDRVPRGVAVDSVTVDNVAAARECVRHILSTGHRRVGIITGTMHSHTAQERLAGFEEGLKEAHIKPKPEWILRGDFHAQSGYRLGRELLLLRDRPSAVLVSNWLMMTGLLKALGELKLSCPEDLSVATFDDPPFSDVFRPRITAVAQPAYSIGYAGAELLIQRIESKRDTENPVAIRLPAELKIRESTIGAKGIYQGP